jgi:preprotein translocase subunit SecA
MTLAQIQKHKQKKGVSTPYATINLKPTQTESQETIEKDLHFGLFVLATEKHESRRIDNQLRGRSGRQGDPGASQFYVALDDEIMRKMGGDTIKSLAKRLLPAEELENLELTQSQFTNAITRAQKQMEGHNFSIRKHLFDYDNVVNKQRMKIYQKRDEILHWLSSDQELIFKEINHIIGEIVSHEVQTRSQKDESVEELLESLNQVFGTETSMYTSVNTDQKIDTLSKELEEIVIDAWKAKMSTFSDHERLIQIIKTFYLQAIDKYWIEHIDTMQHLREKVGLYGYAQQDPLVMYKQEAFKLYEELQLTIKMEFVSNLLRVDFAQFQAPQNTINFEGVDTNEEQFEDNLIGDMNQFVAPTVVDVDTTGVEVIDLSKANKQLLPTDGKKVGPNEPCPCGSGKKYKKCHGAM